MAKSKSNFSHKRVSVSSVRHIIKILYHSYEEPKYKKVTFYELNNHQTE